MAADHLVTTKGGASAVMVSTFSTGKLGPQHLRVNTKREGEGGGGGGGVDLPY